MGEKPLHIRDSASRVNIDDQSLAHHFLTGFLLYQHTSPTSGRMFSLCVRTTLIHSCSDVVKSDTLPTTPSTQSAVITVRSPYVAAEPMHQRNTKLSAASVNGGYQVRLDVPTLFCVHDIANASPLQINNPIRVCIIKGTYSTKFFFSQYRLLF